MAHALASFDIHAHRVLSARTDTADLMLVGHTQALILAATTTLLRAAAATGHVEGQERASTFDHQHRSPTPPRAASLSPGSTPPRLKVALGTSQADWMTMTGLWRDLTATSALRPHPDLIRVAHELRAAVHDVLRDGAGMASPQVIARRINLDTIGSFTSQALSTSLDLAHVTAYAAARADLTGATRGVHALMVEGPCGQSRIDRDPRTPRTVTPGPESAWVSPRDLMLNRAVALPDQVRTLVRKAADEVTFSCGAALDTFSVLDGGSTARASDQSTITKQQRRPGSGRANQDHVADPLSMGMTPTGCER